ncbi:hypothetical protein [Baekduia sp. Peel2402]|uniref:hypothetical protein n=1 Tax=Baekduia sp. Peel2402 TaxID=3458296 RepID=UPI00403E7848
MTQGTMVFLMASAALVLALAALVAAVLVVRAGGHRADERAPVPTVAVAARRMVPRGTVPWNGVAPAPRVFGDARPLGDGPTIGGAGRIRQVPSTRVFVAEPEPARVHGLDGRLSGRVMVNPDALCTVCGARLSDCGGHS